MYRANLINERLEDKKRFDGGDCWHEDGKSFLVTDTKRALKANSMGRRNIDYDVFVNN